MQQSKHGCQDAVRESGHLLQGSRWVANAQGPQLPPNPYEQGFLKSKLWEGLQGMGSACAHSSDWLVVR